MGEGACTHIQETRTRKENTSSCISFLNLEEVEEILVRKINEGRGGRFGLTQGGRKPVVTKSHASKKAREEKLFSQQGGKTGKVQHNQHGNRV